MWYPIYRTEYLRSLFSEGGEYKMTYIKVDNLYFTQTGKMVIPIYVIKYVCIF